MPLPTFVILGAQKCGTTTLSRTFKRHPQIHMARRKEMHHFDRDNEQSLDWYAEQFTPGKEHLAWGESTPSYIFLAPARRRCAAALPDAKFIVMLRDPAKRAYSHFWHNQRFNAEPSTSFLEAIDLEPHRLATGKRVDRMRFSYMSRGRYAEQLEAMEALVGRERLHVILLEDLETDREATLEGVFRFIGVDPAFASRIPALHRVPKSAGADIPADYPPMPTEIRARLIDELGPSTRALEKWLQRDLSAWLTV